MTTPATDDEVGRLFDTFGTAFRLEQQRQYTMPDEAETFALWKAGQRVPLPQVPGLQEWYDQIREWVAAGRTISRVRIQDTPATSYQQWERWGGRWNAEAGEQIQYMTRVHATDVGLLPAAAGDDWWLFDDSAVLVMQFDEEGHLGDRVIITDPNEVATYRAWRDLAVHHSAPDEGHVAA